MTSLTASFSLFNILLLLGILISLYCFICSLLYFLFIVCVVYVLPFGVINETRTLQRKLWPLCLSCMEPAGFRFAVYKWFRQ